MSADPIGTAGRSPLRNFAEARLKNGTAPVSLGGAADLEALTLLHSLASAPESAGDALKLLHELQVHQVELDLQHEEIELSRSTLTKALDRHVELYDFAPVAYVTVDPDGKILEGNLAAARLFSIERANWSGRRIDAFLAPESRPGFARMLGRLGASGMRETCAARSASGARPLQVVANPDSEGRSFLIALVETTDHAWIDTPA